MTSTLWRSKRAAVGMSQRCRGGRHGSSCVALTGQEGSGVGLKKRSDNQHVVGGDVWQGAGVGGGTVSARVDRRRRDRGRRRRKLTYGMEEDAARREDDDEDDEGRSEDSGGPICRPGQKTGGGGGTPSCPSSGDGDDGRGGGGALRTTAPKLSASADNGSSARRDRGGKPPSSSSSGAKRTAKGRRRRRKKLHGDVMTTFNKVACRPRRARAAARACASRSVGSVAPRPGMIAKGHDGRRM